MSAIGDAIKDIGQGIEGAVEGVAKGIGDAVEGIGKMAEGALTLNPSEAMSGLEDVGSGALEGVGSAAALTPEGLAANSLLEGGSSLLGSAESAA